MSDGDMMPVSTGRKEHGKANTEPISKTSNSAALYAKKKSSAPVPLSWTFHVCHHRSLLEIENSPLPFPMPAMWAIPFLDTPDIKAAGVVSIGPVLGDVIALDARAARVNLHRQDFLKRAGGSAKPSAGRGSGFICIRSSRSSFAPAAARPTEAESGLAFSSPTLDAERYRPRRGDERSPSKTFLRT